MTGSSRVRRLKRQKRWRSDQQRVTAKKAIGYIRVSTAEQASGGYGLEAQEKAIRAFAESQGYKLLGVQ